MKKINFCFLSILSLILAIIMVLSNTSIVNATNTQINEETSTEIIGQSNGTSSISGNTLPNIAVLDWVATENSIILHITNYGIDSVDIISGTINTGNLTKNFTYKNVSAAKHTYSVTVPIKTCHEDISIRYWAIDGGDTFGTTTSYGQRDIPKKLLNKWSTGSFATRAKCLNYHFKKHGTEVSASNICSYVRLANTFRTHTIPNQNLTPYKKVTGAIANVYRYRNAYFYLDVVCSNGKPNGDLVSFGAR